VVTPEGGGRLVPLPGGAYSLAKRWAQDLRVPLDGVAGVDLTDITQVDLRSESSAGKVWVLDLSSIPAAGLSVQPARDVPKLSIGHVTQAEGDAPGLSTIAVPYTVGGGTLVEDAAVRVVSVDEFGGGTGAPTILDIPAGTESGTIALTYRANTRDDLARRQQSIAVYPIEGVATNRYIGGATIVDDDPSPRVTLAPVRKRIHEGATARWRVSLSKPVGYFLDARARPVRAEGKGKQLTVGDLPKKFREDHFFPVPPLDRALFKTDLRLYSAAPPGRTSIVVELPTRAGKRDEGRRSITLRFRVGGQLPLAPTTATVIVTD